MKAKLVLLMISLVAMMGCNALEKESLSGTLLVIKSITGKDSSGKDGSSVIYSDVIKGDGTIFDDGGVVAATAKLLDPLYAASTFYQDVVVDQVDVKFSRTDGRNVEGKDVPYGFSQPTSVFVVVGKDVSFNVVLISHNAKMEAPLIDLRDLGQEKVLVLNTTLTFHAKDMAGKRLEPVSRTITVWCANFADAAAPTPAP